MMSHELLWERIEVLRKQRNLTLKELGDRSGRSRSYLQKLQRGESNPSIEVLRDLARVLRVHPSDLISAMYEDFIRPLDIRTEDEKRADIDHAYCTPFEVRDRNEKYGEYDTAYVGDVTYPDNSIVAVRQTFEKIWEIQNVGKQPWVGFRLVNTDDPTMPGYLNPAERDIHLPVVKPRETTQISVTFTAPWFAGTFISRWKLFDHDGLMVFPDKIGLWCQVVVEDL